MKTRPKNRSLVRRSPASAIAGVAVEIRDLIEAARCHVSVTANLALVSLYWNIGRVIAQDIQKNVKRAGYGEQLVEQLSAVLTRDYGRGYSATNLWDMKRFFGCFDILQTTSGESSSERICQTVPNKLPRPTILQTASEEICECLTIDFRRHFRLGWSHYRILLSQNNPVCRKFYFEQAAEQHWAVRELRRQIDRGLFERVALAKNTRRLVKQEKEDGPHEIVRYEDIFKDPYVLDFLGLKGVYSEKDLEAAIIRNLEQFLTELGTDFCFIGRQYAMRVDDEDYFLDLLFYHRGLHCLVAIDLKIGTFTAADKGQMDLYLSWLKEHDWREGETEPVGLILCTSAKRQHVELLLRHGPHRMKVAEYRTHLPDKHLLEERLKVYSRLLKEHES
jgi:predicted nuclease of restriction endonuclease-like (RecB) superfamily